MGRRPQPLGDGDPAADKWVHGTADKILNREGPASPRRPSVPRPPEPGSTPPTSKVSRTAPKYLTNKVAYHNYPHALTTSSKANTWCVNVVTLRKAA